jgi:hypothetical protein
MRRLVWNFGKENPEGRKVAMGSRVESYGILGSINPTTFDYVADSPVEQIKKV